MSGFPTPNFKVAGKSQKTPAKQIQVASDTDTDTDDELCSTRFAPKVLGKPVTPSKKRASAKKAKRSPNKEIKFGSQSDSSSSESSGSDSDSDTPAKPAGKAAAAGRKPADVKPAIAKPIGKAAKGTGITLASQRSAKSRVLSGQEGADLLLSDADCLPDSPIMQMIRTSGAKFGDAVDLINAHTTSRIEKAVTRAFIFKVEKKTVKKPKNKKGGKKGAKPVVAVVRSGYRFARCCIEGVDDATGAVAIHVVDETTGEIVKGMRFPGMTYSQARVSVEQIRIKLPKE